MENIIKDSENIINSLIPILVEHGLSLLGAIVILVIGWSIARWASRRVHALVSKWSYMDKTLVPIVSKTTHLLIMIVTILAVLNQFGVQTTSIVAILGAATLAIGLGLQGTLSNVAAGVMLLTFRPFKVDDFITVKGIAGSVVEIGLFTTKMKTADGISIIVPNSNIWGNEITNFSKNPTRRIDLVFGISYTDDMDKALRLIHEVIQADQRIHKDPEPIIAVHNLGESSVDIIVRPWVNTADFWQTRWDLTKKTKESFDKNGISIPFPQRDVHLIQSNG